jgi:hypothetical protein
MTTNFDNYKETISKGWSDSILETTSEVTRENTNQIANEIVGPDVTISFDFDSAKGPQFIEDSVFGDVAMKLGFSNLDENKLYDLYQATYEIGYSGHTKFIDFAIENHKSNYRVGVHNVKGRQAVLISYYSLKKITSNPSVQSNCVNAVEKTISQIDSNAQLLSTDFNKFKSEKLSTFIDHLNKIAEENKYVDQATDNMKIFKDKKAPQ